MNTHTTIRPSAIDREHLCCHCDSLRADLVAWCPSCEEFTESYTLDEDAPLALNLARQLDAIAARRAAIEAGAEG